MTEKNQSDNNRILIIDDNPNIFNDFKSILKEKFDHSKLDKLSEELFGNETQNSPVDCQYILEYARQGEEGFQLVKKSVAEGNPYQLAFVDMRMPPGWDGLETIEHLWEVDPYLQVIICTAYSDHSWEDITHRLGSTDQLLILKKPFDSVEVSQMANAMTKKWHLSKQATMKLSDLDREVKAQTHELTQTNQRLHESEERFRTLVEQAGDAIITFSPEGRILDVNQQSCKNLGYSCYELVNMAIQDLDSQCISQQHDLKFWDQLKAGSPITYESMFKRKDNSTFPVEVRLTEIQLGGKSFIMAIVRDITKRKLAEAEHRKLEAHLRQEKKMESLQVMAGSIAHNFNNMLTAVLGNLELAMLDIPSNSLAKQNILKAHKVSKNAAELSSLMLTYVGQRQGTFRPINLPILMEDILELLWAAIPRNINKDYQILDSQIPINCDPGQIQQVVISLVNNSIEAIGEKSGEIKVTTGKMTCDKKYLKESYFNENQPVGEYAFFEVEDNGCGMDDDILSKIFDPYFTTKFTGRGLGMAAVLGIIRSHKGAINIRSKPGVGSCLRILIPVSKDKNNNNKIKTAN